ncbi:hypothetical protein FB451DRAFT_1375606 [Mycena latifolia]|nr:hypothetical protein FB451DRAFT_1375606 [Mycena latifolia]
MRPPFARVDPRHPGRLAVSSLLLFLQIERAPFATISPSTLEAPAPKLARAQAETSAREAAALRHQLAENAAENARLRGDVAAARRLHGIQRRQLETERTAFEGRAKALQEAGGAAAARSEGDGGAAGAGCEGPEEMCGAPGVAPESAPAPVPASVPDPRVRKVGRHLDDLGVRVAALDGAAADVCAHMASLRMRPSLSLVHDATPSPVEDAPNAADAHARCPAAGITPAGAGIVLLERGVREHPTLDVPVPSAAPAPSAPPVSVPAPRNIIASTRAAIAARGATGTPRRPRGRAAFDRPGRRALRAAPRAGYCTSRRRARADSLWFWARGRTQSLVPRMQRRHTPWWRYAMGVGSWRAWMRRWRPMHTPRRGARSGGALAFPHPVPPPPAPEAAGGAEEDRCPL